MKITQIAFFIAIYFGPILGWADTTQRIEFQTQENEFCFVFIEGEETDRDCLKAFAKQEIEAFAHRKGYQSYTICSEKEIYVMQSRGENRFPINLYQEVVVRGGKGTAELGRGGTVRLESGYQVIFRLKEHTRSKTTSIEHEQEHVTTYRHP